MVFVAERFRRQVVVLVYAGLNPVEHTKFNFGSVLKLVEEGGLENH